MSWEALKADIKKRGNSTPVSAFNRLVKMERKEHGTEGVSFGQKDLGNVNCMGMVNMDTYDGAVVMAEHLADKLLEDVNGHCAEKFGPAGYITLEVDFKVKGWLFFCHVDS